MRFSPFVYLLLICIFFSGGCGKRVEIDRILASADALMNVDRDSADVLLRSLQPRLSTFSEKEKAYYLLLRTQADYLAGTITSDSVIQEAVCYYEKSSDENKLAKAYLYQGKASTLLKNDSAALIYYMKAADRASQENDTKLLTDIYNSSGYIYLMQNLPEQALQNFKKAWFYMNASHEQKQFRFYLLRNMARAYSLQRILGSSPESCTDSAVYYFEKSLADTFSVPTQEEIRTVNRELSILYAHMKNYDKAMTYINTGSTSGKPNSSSVTKAWIYAKMGQEDSAYQLARKNTENPNIYSKTTAYDLLFEIERKRGRLKSALSYVDTLRILNDSIFKYVIPESIIEIQKKYNDEKLRAEKAEAEMNYEKEKSHSLMVTLMVILLLISGAVFIAYTYFRQKRLQHSILEQKNELLLLKQKIQVWDQQVQMSQSRIRILQTEKQQVENDLNLVFQEKEKILKEKDAELTLLRKQENEWQEKKCRYEALCFSEFKKQFSAHPFSRKIPAFGSEKVVTDELSATMQKQLMTVMNETCCGFATRIYDLTQESAEKTCLCCLLKLQVKPRYIMVLCGLSKEVYSKRCQRLAENLTGQSNMQALKAYLYAF